jgi:hypothetical protein
MVTKDSKRVRQGSRVPVVMVPNDRLRAKAEIKAGLAARAKVVPYTSRPRIAFYMLHTRYARTPEARDSYGPILLELGVLIDEYSRAVADHSMLDFLGTEPFALEGSGREIWPTVRLQAGSPVTDGLFLTTRLRSANGDVDEREVIGLTHEWSPRVPYTLRSEDLRALIATTPTDAPGLPGLKAALVKNDREALESWDFAGQYFVGADGTQLPALVPGAYDLGVRCLRHAQPWDSWDEANYVVTVAPVAAAPHVGMPAARAATNMSTSFDVFLAPQYLSYLVQWYAIYAIGTIFFLSFVAIAQTGIFVGPLPILPKPYSLDGGTQNAANGVAISEYVRQTQTYARMIAADLALNSYSPFFFIILTERIGGRVTLIQRIQPAGVLCAVVDCRAGDGPAVRRYVYRRTPLVRDEPIVDQVALNTPDVIGADQLFLDGSDPPVPAPGF